MRRALHLLEKLQEMRDSVQQGDGDVQDQQAMFNIIMSQLGEIKTVFADESITSQLVKRLDKSAKKRVRDAD